MAEKDILECAASLGLTVESEFVPLSKSRNADRSQYKEGSLNWRVTLLMNGRGFLTVDYSAGVAHCPSYKQMWGGQRRTVYEQELLNYEMEHGKQARPLTYVGQIIGGKPILPKTADVLHSIINDADVINYPNFEQWAESVGFDTDSRKAEAIYKACLDYALKLRANLGEAGLAKLTEACQDY